MIDLVRYLVRAVKYPVTPLPTVPFFRRLMLLPVLYDVSSTLVQLHSLRHIANTSKPAIGDDDYYERVQTYNASVTSARNVMRSRRAEELFAALRLPPRDLNRERLLLIGPRTVQELFLGWLYGFSWENIEGIDLYRTHPKIKVMNMEAMSFAAASFDSILMSATLAYAKNIHTCLAECERVLRPGGHLVFGQTFCPGSEFQGSKTSGDETRRILLQLNLEPFYYRQAEKIDRLGNPTTYHLFGVRKPDGMQVFDPVRWAA